jgi:spermidine synthase
MACVSRQTDPLTLLVDDIARRLVVRKIGDLRFYSEQVHHALFAQPNYVRELIDSI